MNLTDKAIKTVKNDENEIIKIKGKFNKKKKIKMQKKRNY